MMIEELRGENNLDILRLNIYDTALDIKFILKSETVLILVFIFNISID